MSNKPISRANVYETFMNVVSAVPFVVDIWISLHKGSYHA